MRKYEFFLSVFSLILLFLLVWGMSGCSAKYHLNRYQAKGGICGNVDTIQIIDSFPVVKKDTVIWKYFHRDSVYVVNDRIVPRTRLEVRTDYKIHRDTVKLKETVIKHETKQQKSEDRKIWVWVVMGAMGLVALYLIKKG